MRALLDVNVLIALLDADHPFHNRAHAWWLSSKSSGWASCAITENAVVRIMANPSYGKKKPFSPAAVIGALEIFCSQTNHEFWPENLSLRDQLIFSRGHILSSQQLTDSYLLALAAKHQGQLVTFDQNISLNAVRIAKSQNLNVL
jgi:toxin-antitoxin system PIN domain toxin